MPVSNERLIGITIDDNLAAAISSEFQHDRDVAIRDLIEANNFALSSGPKGPYNLHLASQDQRLVFQISNMASEPLHIFALGLGPFRRVVKDYFQICDSYNMAVKASNPQAIEAIDMARRAIHNEGSEILQTRFNGKVEMDFDTARRLFTLVCALTARAS